MFLDLVNQEEKDVDQVKEDELNTDLDSQVRLRNNI